MRLAGKRVLVTGTGPARVGGIGEAIQAAFAREGARVIGCDIIPGAAEETAGLLRQEGRDARGYDLDLADYQACRAWVQEAHAALGGIDVLVNNGAGFATAPFTHMNLEMWRHVMQVELDVVFHTTSPAWEHLRASAGVVVNIASISGMVGIEPLGQVAHAAAKGGVIALTKSLAAEGAAEGVRANSISPGYIAGPENDDLGDWELGRQLLRRPGTADDVAALAVYLAADESSWVTGQNFVVDGGMTAGFRP